MNFPPLNNIPVKKKILRIILLFIVILGATWLLGPKPDKPLLSTELPQVEVELTDLAEWLWLENGHLTIKPGNESIIEWADSIPAKTEYVILYLHGFSASPMEGMPVARNVAQTMGMNLYAPLLYGHGLVTEDALIDMYPDSLWNSALRAFAVARLMGEKVIVMGTSTGGTLALNLAAEFDTEGLVLLSPNVRVNHDNAELLHGPWGLQIARLVVGEKHLDITGKTEEYAKYWYTRYRLEGTVYLGALLNSTMQPETFQKITEPVMIGAYYKDEEHQDPVVKVSAMHWMYDHLFSSKKEFVEFPYTENHVMCCYITSKDLESVERECVRFLNELISE